MKMFRSRILFLENMTVTILQEAVDIFAFHRFRPNKTSTPHNATKTEHTFPPLNLPPCTWDSSLSGYEYQRSKNNISSLFSV